MLATHFYIFIFKYWLECVYVYCVPFIQLFRRLELCILENVRVQLLYRASLPKWGILGYVVTSFFTFFKKASIYCQLVSSKFCI